MAAAQRWRQRSGGGGSSATHRVQATMSVERARVPAGDGAGGHGAGGHVVPCWNHRAALTNRSRFCALFSWFCGHKKGQNPKDGASG